MTSPPPAGRPEFHWSADDAGGFARSFDTHPGEKGQADVVAIPGRLSGPVTAEA